MLTEKYYQYLNKSLEVPIEEAIVFKIIENITNRRGLSQSWDAIDEEIQNQILSELTEIVQTLFDLYKIKRK